MLNQVLVQQGLDQTPAKAAYHTKIAPVFCWTKSVERNHVKRNS